MVTICLGINYAQTISKLTLNFNTMKKVAKNTNQLFTIAIEQTNAKNEINFKTQLEFNVKNETTLFKETAVYIVDFCNLQAKLKDRKLALYGVKGLTKSGKIHITLRSKAKKTCEFCIRNFGRFVQQSTEQQIAEVMQLVYEFTTKHSNVK
jgi:hypothetical protein